MPDHSLLLEFPPEGWSSVRLEEICDRVQDAAVPIPNGDRLYIGLEHIAAGFPSLIGQGVETDVKSGKTAFRAGDVLFGKLRPYLQKSVLVAADGICSTDILVFRTKPCLDPQYLCYLTHSREFVEHAKSTQSGVQHPRTSWASLKPFEMHLPPLQEQLKIAAVLSLVQRAIEQQERLITLTTELKKALMHKLFTEGLRGEPQKQTEIGPIPQNWELRTIRELDLDIGDGNYSTKYPRKDAFTSAGVPFVRASNIQDGRISWKDMRFISDELHSTLLKGHLKSNDVCLVTRGDIGSIAFVTGEFVGANMNAQLVRLNGEDKMNGKYLYFSLSHPMSQEQIKSLQTGTALQQLPLGKLKFVKIPVPPIDEQIDLGTTLWLVEENSGCARRKLDVYRELFQTLLHRMMTGQIRVNDLDFQKRPVSNTF